jgi:Ca2+-binding RTX toxin-like protein
MAHVFDYSASRIGLGAISSVDDLFFGWFNGASAMPAEYWVGNGALNGGITWLEYDYSVTPERPYIVSGRTLLDAHGNDQVVGPGQSFLPVEAANLHQAEAPPAYFNRAGKLVLSTVYDGYASGSYLAFSDLLTPTRSLIGHPSAAYASYQDAAWGMRLRAERANDDFRADLQTLAQTSLGDAGFMTVRVWNDQPQRANDFVLTYSPDANTRLQVDDLVDFNSPGTNPGYGQILPHTELFRGEDVSLILTGQDDRMFFNALPARRLTIQLGAGDDLLTFGNDIAGTGGRSHLPLALSVSGGAGTDWIAVSAALQTTVSGGGGADDLSVSGAGPGQGAAAILLGGAGNDTLHAEGIDTRMNGEAGDDLVTGATGSDTLRGGSGNDFLSDVAASNGSGSRYFGASNLMFGGDGKDYLWGGAGDDRLYGGGWADTLWGGLGDDVMAGGAGTDAYEWGSVYQGFHTPLGDDTLIDRGGLIVFSDFTPFASIDTGSMIRVGKDLLIGEVGVSSLRISGFYDRPRAWSGAVDQGAGLLRDPEAIDLAAARGLAQTARLGSGGADVIRLDGPATTSGRAGADRILGSAGRDLLFGDGGNDVIEGRAGRDRLLGGTGDDRLYGGGLADLLAGNQGDDRLFGGTGHDRLYGGGDDDRLSGGGGADLINGGAGNDTLRGGDGADRFEFVMGFGTDHIADLERGDRVWISHFMLVDLPNPDNVTPASLVQLFGSTVNGSLVLDFGSGDRIIVDGITNRTLLSEAIILF